MKRQYFNLHNMPLFDPNQKKFPSINQVGKNPAFREIKFARVPNMPINKQVTNNFMILTNPKTSFVPMALSSSSRKVPSTIGLENSGSKFKLKYHPQSYDKVGSPAKTESSVSHESASLLKYHNQLVHPVSRHAYMNPQVDPARLRASLFYPFKSPNFNKNLFNASPLTPNVFESGKLNPEQESEILKKVMQIFLKMDSTRKKEIAIYKKKLIPLFEKLQLTSHRMKTLQEFMEKFLMNEPILPEDLERLNVAEKLVFMAFLVKKKYFDVDCFDFKSETLRFFQERNTMKRNEQEYKIVLKKAFKTMINAFNQERGFYDSSKRHFYKEFFGEFARSQSIPLEDLELENLFNEKGTKKPKKRKSKKNYAQILRTSPRFLERLSEYLDNKFMVGPKQTGSKFDAIREIKKKVPDLINKWKTRMLMEEDNPPHIQMAEFFCKFFTNKKVKLPWSVNEINRAVKSVKQLLQIN